MRSSFSFLPLLALPFLALPPAAHGQSGGDLPSLSGYVTETHSSTEVTVDGRNVRIAPGATLYAYEGKTRDTLSQPTSFYLGEYLKVYGKTDQTHILRATRVDRIDAPLDSISGKAIIDLSPAVSNLRTNERVLRADGYLLHISPGTELILDKPLQALADLGTNQWIEFHGNLRSDGSVSVVSAKVGQNLISKAESDLHEKKEFEPAKVTEADKQTRANKVFLGVNLKKIPAYENAEMQARVDRIAASLIPKYQRDLLQTDPTKLKFRFQLVDLPKTNFAFSFANGINLVPYQLVERLGNDSQLAAILADNIAEILEKQAFRSAPAFKMVTATSWVVTGAEIFVPGIGLATGIGLGTDLVGGGIAGHLIELQNQQSGRVSLCLLHDAGYDLSEAPIAWWLLAGKENKPLTSIKLPHRALYLYEMLGRAYRPEVMPPAPIPAT